jgi:hypothetical protein
MGFAMVAYPTSPIFRVARTIENALAILKAKIDAFILDRQSANEPNNSAIQTQNLIAVPANHVLSSVAMNGPFG